MASAFFSHPIRLRFRQADPAGILFFGTVYPLAHDAYEEFIQHLGFEWKEWFQNPEWAVPIRHSSCEHYLPMTPAQTYHARVVADRIGESSFTLKYVFEESQKTYCEVSLVHTFLNKKTREKMNLPSLVRERLETYKRQCLPA